MPKSLMTCFASTAVALLGLVNTASVNGGDGEPLVELRSHTHPPTMDIAADVMPEAFPLELPFEDRWPQQGRRVLDEDHVWGRRVDLRQVFRIGGQWALLYGSRPGSGDEAEASLTVSLAFSPDLAMWVDSPANPILDRIEQPWQGNRARAQGLVWDSDRRRWVLLIGGNGEEHVPGLRAVGVAYSEDLKDWTFEPDNPVVTVDTGDLWSWACYS